MVNINAKNAVLQERKRFEKILQDNLEETQWANVDDNEIAKVSIKNFVDAVKASLNKSV